MHDEYRVRVDIGAAQERALLATLESLELSDEEHRALGRVAVTHDDGEVFLYADSPDVAERARRAVAQALATGGLQAQVSTWRWHPEEERWEDAARPLPATEEQRAIEHEARVEQETRESRRAGAPQWEVRVTLPGHQEAREFADRLEAEGIPVARRWRYVLAGAENEDEAAALAERLRSEAPMGSDLKVEGSGTIAMRALQGPFAVFGGMGV